MAVMLPILSVADRAGADVAPDDFLEFSWLLFRGQGRDDCDDARSHKAEAIVVERTPERVVVEAAQGELLFGHVEFFAQECPHRAVAGSHHLAPRSRGAGTVSRRGLRSSGGKRAIARRSSPNRWGRFASLLAAERDGVRAVSDELLAHWCADRAAGSAMSDLNQAMPDLRVLRLFAEEFGLDDLAEDQRDLSQACAFEGARGA